MSPPPSEAFSDKFTGILGQFEAWTKRRANAIDAIGQRSLQRWRKGNVEPSEGSYAKLAAGISSGLHAAANNAEAAGREWPYPVRITAEQIREAFALEFGTRDVEDESNVLETELSRLSHIALNDASQIPGLTDREGNLTNLYTPRISAEKRILGLLHEQQSSSHPIPLVIVSEPGTGKTSLLWRLVSELIPKMGISCWMLKSSLLFARDGEPALSPEKLVALAEEETSQVRGVLCIDTIDLLLHDERSRLQLVTLLQTLVQHCGIQVIATCRPNEYAALRSLQTQSVELGNYSESELTVAVKNHVRVFQRGVDHEAQLLSIENAVAKNRPVKDLCKNPLTLRMLFAIYQPRQVHEEVNTHSLYCQYWALRVQDDRRPESPLEGQEKNLELVAESVAMAMLGERVPELPRMAIESLAGCAREGIDTLIARGILRIDEQGLVSFFHQTFFEYAAARVLLRHNCVNAIAEDVEQNPLDSFLLPLFENVTLLCQGSDLFDKIFRQTVASKQISLRHASMYVFANRLLPVGKVSLRALLDASRSWPLDFTKYAISLCSNVVPTRRDELFSLLQALWRDEWKFIAETFKLFQRVSHAFPKEIVTFLDEKDRFRQSLELEMNGMSNLGDGLDVCGSLVDYEPQWAWQYLKIIHSKIATDPGSQVLHRRLAKVLARGVDGTIRGEVQNFIERWVDIELESMNHARHSAGMCWSYGNVMGAIWEVEGRAMRLICNEIADCSGLKKRLLVAGLSHYLLRLEKQDVRYDFECVIELQRKDNDHDFWLWQQAFWSPLFSSDLCPDWCCVFVREKLIETVNAKASEGQNGHGFFFAKMLTQFSVTPKAFRGVFADDAFATEESWTKNRRLAYLIVKGALVGLKVPKSIIGEAIVRRDRDFCGRLVGNLSNTNRSCLSIVENEIDVWQLMLRLAIGGANLPLIKRALEELLEAGQLSSLDEDLKKQVGKATEWQSSSEELTSCKIWMEATCCEQGWIDDWNLSGLSEDLNRLRSKFLQKELLRKLSLAFRAEACSSMAAFTILQEFCDREIGKPVREQAHQIMIEIAASDPQQYGLVAFKLVDVAPRDAAPLLAAFVAVIYTVYERDRAEGLRLFQRFALIAAVFKAGRTLRTKLCHALHRLFREALQLKEGRALYEIEFLKSAPIEFGQAILDFVCLSHTTEELQEMVDVGLPEKLEKMILRALRRDRNCESVHYGFLDLLPSQMSNV